MISRDLVRNFWYKASVFPIFTLVLSSEMSGKSRRQRSNDARDGQRLTGRRFSARVSGSLFDNPNQGATMDETAKRRILFFCLPVFAAATLHAVLEAAGLGEISAIAAAIAAAAAAFLLGFRYLEDRDTVILNDHAYQPAFACGLAATPAGLLLGGKAAIGMFPALLIALAGFAAVGCVSSYLDIDRPVTTAEKRGLFAGIIGQMTAIALLWAAGDIGFSGAIAGAALTASVWTRFWRIEAPETKACI
jgi:hypothetical protein